MSRLIRVFVYGTLKTGQPNNGVLSSPENGFAQLIGLGSTAEKYPLVVASRYNIPFLLNKQGIGKVSDINQSLCVWDPVNESTQRMCIVVPR